MNVPAPHFLLFSESSRKQRQGQWRFLLKAVDGTEQLEAADAEPEVQGERLDLLAVVRGLEALDQPSRVTLVTSSKYVHRGLLYGLEEWRSNGWSWEHFGQMVPVKNRDLWQRLDRALSIHDLEFQPWRVDQPHLEGTAIEETPAVVRVAAVPLAGSTIVRNGLSSRESALAPGRFRSFEAAAMAALPEPGLWLQWLAKIRFAVRVWRSRMANRMVPFWAWNKLAQA